MSLPSAHSKLETAAKDAWSRWLPTLLAIIGVAGSLLYESRDYGKLEQRVTTIESRQAELISAIDKMNTNMIPRSEYSANVLRADENQRAMVNKLESPSGAGVRNQSESRGYPVRSYYRFALYFVGRVIIAQPWPALLHEATTGGHQLINELTWKRPRVRN